MKGRNGTYLASQGKKLTRRLVDYLTKPECCDANGLSGTVCCAACASTCESASGWPEVAAEKTLVYQAGEPTLDSFSTGETARIEGLFLPMIVRRRLLSMGLTCGTEVAVINKENGRMIIAVRDSRLGLSPEIAAKITCAAA